MEQSRKHLKISSLLVLLFAAFSLLNLVSELFLGELNNATIPEGAPTNIVSITQTILLVMSLLFLAPECYVGIKGLRIAKNPNSSKGHIVWATIIFVITLINLVSPLIGLVSDNNTEENISTLLSLGLNASIYFDYIKYARIVAKENA